MNVGSVIKKLNPMVQEYEFNFDYWYNYLLCGWYRKFLSIHPDPGEPCSLIYLNFWTLGQECALMEADRFKSL